MMQNTTGGRPEDLPADERISFLPIPSSTTSFERSAAAVSAPQLSSVPSSTVSPTAPHSRSSGPSVDVTATSWSRDSHDLFDFEATTQKVTQNFAVVGRSATFVRQGTQVEMLTEHAAQTKPGFDTLVRVVRRDGVHWVDRASGSSKRLWLVVRDLPAKAHALSEGDLFKLGRFKLRVKQIVTDMNSSVQPDLSLDTPEPGEGGGRQRVCMAAASTREAALQSGFCCRICLLEDEQPTEDPLIAPCKCKGTMEYVHLGCLRHWIRLRPRQNEGPGGSYFYRPAVCELCKTGFPDYVDWRGEQTPLTEVPRTQPPFIVLQNTVQEAHPHGHRGLHVVSLAEDKLLKLGRGHESDVRIPDVSISRWHATIRMEDGKFLLEDRDSKFGTLVALKKPRPLDPRNPTSIQMGRTVVAMSLRTEKKQEQQPGAVPIPPAFNVTSSAGGAMSLVV